MHPNAAQIPAELRFEKGADQSGERLAAATQGGVGAANRFGLR